MEDHSQFHPLCQKHAFDIADGTVNGPPFHIQVVKIDITDPFTPSSIHLVPQA